jgi:putative phosphoribosyl transferase
LIGLTKSDLNLGAKNVRLFLREHLGNKMKVYEIPGMRDKRAVFKDRSHAGEVLAQMLRPNYMGKENNIIFAIPAGGVPVGLMISKALNLNMDLVIVRKIQIPGNTEAGFGAMTLDGSTFLNETLIAQLNLSSFQVRNQIDVVKKELERRNKLFRQNKPMPSLHGQAVVLVDDGLASGYTMMASAHMVKQHGAEKVIAAVPTAPSRSIENIKKDIDELYCANIRDEAYFAVAEAYEQWHDLTEDEVLRFIRNLWETKIQN